MLRKFWNKYKDSLKKDALVHILVLVGLFGMVCILASSCLEQEETEDTTETAAVYSNTEMASQESYRLELQQQLENMLGSIAGVGEVEVLVTIQGSEAYHYAQDADSKYVTVGGSQKEALVESVSHPQVTGVVVACEGGGSSAVQEMVYQAVSVACDLRSTQIYVTQLERSAIRKES